MLVSSNGFQYGVTFSKSALAMLSLIKIKDVSERSKRGVTTRESEKANLTRCRFALSPFGTMPLIFLLS